MHRKYITAKLGGMRKADQFVVYAPREDGRIMAQGDRTICLFDPTTRRGLLNWRGSNSKYFIHLNPIAGAEPYEFPQEFVDACINEMPNHGEAIDARGTVRWA
jgi:hypothetical protein